MVPEVNHAQTRESTSSGWPKKNAALFGSSEKKGGISGGFVITCKKTNTAASISTCQRRSALLVLLLLIALEDFVLHRLPDARVQLDEARREPDLGHVARPRQADAEPADRARCGAGGQHHHAIRKRNRFLQIVRDEHHGLAVGRPQLEQLVLHELP